MRDSVTDCAFGQDWEPRTTNIHRHGEVIVEAEEVEVAGYVGNHGVDHNVTNRP